MSVRVLALFIILNQVGVMAQAPSVKVSKAGTDSSKAPSVIRQGALSTLETVVDELPAIDDIDLRIQVTEKVVRLLAASRPDRCRRALDLLFAKASAARNERAKDQPDRERADLALRKIIQIAAFLDSKLAQSYIEAYLEEQRFEETTSASGQRESQIALAYLKIATQLVQKDPNLAVLTATRSFRAGVMPETLVFLATLRKKDVGLANRFFLSVLHSSRARSGNDVNELLLLYAFVFSPLRIPVVMAEGVGVLSIPEYLAVAQSYPIDSLLAKQYLEVSTKMLLDSNRYLPQNLERLTKGPLGDFYFISIIEQKASAYLPDFAQTISQQRNVLANYLQSSDRAGAFASIERWNSIPREAKVFGPGNKATVDYFASQAERASDPRLRDQFYFRSALAAIHDQQDERAIELAAKLSPEYSNQAQLLIRFALAERKVRDGQLDEAEQFARRDESLVRKCYILTLIAQSLLGGKSKDNYRAAQLLQEVYQLTDKLSSQKERLSVLNGLAAVFSRFDVGRGFELLRETIKSANKSDRFTGDISIPLNLNVGGFLFAFSLYEDEFSFFDLLSKLAASDFYEALFHAREIQNRPLRIHSIVVVCSAALPTT